MGRKRKKILTRCPSPAINPNPRPRSASTSNHSDPLAPCSSVSPPAAASPLGFPPPSAPAAAMPRRSGGGGRSRPAPRAAPRAAPVRNPPQPARQAPPPAPAPQSSGGGIMSGIGSTIAQGMAFGTGSAVAHRAVDAVMGPRTIQHETVVSEAASSMTPMGNTAGSDSCDNSSKAFQDCINHYGSDISKCQFYLDMLNECRRGGAGAGSTL